MKLNEFYEDHVMSYLTNLSWEFLRGKSIFIAGACGMIGSALVDLIMMANREYNLEIHIYALGRHEQKARARFESYFRETSLFTFIEGDVTNFSTIIGKVDFIVHAANSAHPAAYKIDPVGIMKANFEGTCHLLEIAQQHNARLLLISSGEIYGETNTELKTEEDYGYVNSMEVRSCYPNSKRAAETLCVAYGYQYGTDSVIVRPSHVYGPTMTESDNRAISDFIKHGLTNENIIMKSTGNVVRTYTYVFDACLGILKAMEKGKISEAYNIADKKSVISIKELANLIADKCGVKVIMQLPNSSQSEGFTPIKRQVMDAEKLSGLGWTCYKDIASGIDCTLKSLTI